MEKLIPIINQVLADIVPRESDRKKIETLSQELEKKLAIECEKAGIEATIGIEGSIAKDTWLLDDPDIDVFIRLPITIPKENFGEDILKIAKKATKGSKQVQRYAEHPYLEAFINDVRVNIVPCYQVDIGNWKSATDRTPYHSKYVRKHLNQELKNQVRLLKKFFKGINVYGAEIKTGGFSGYLCELLILHYRSFIKTLEAFSNYKKPIIIDLKNFYKEKKVDLVLLFSDPLIVIDPVDKNRNVASALTSETLYELVGATRAFLRKPNKDFFFPKKIKIFSKDTLLSKFENRGSSILFIQLNNIHAVPDVLWGQLFKTQKSLIKLLTNNDFTILQNAIWSDEKSLTVFIIEVETHILPKIKQHFGPPLEFNEQSITFLLKYVNNTSVISGPFLQNNRWTIILNRIYSNAVSLLEEKLLTDNKNIGFPNLILKAIKKNLRIFINNEIVALYHDNPDFAAFITSFLIGKPSWLKSYYC